MDLWLRENYPDVNVTRATSKSGQLFLLCWSNPKVTEYLPEFFLAVTEGDAAAAAAEMKVLTFHGKVIAESKAVVSDGARRDFVAAFLGMRLCRGVDRPNADGTHLVEEVAADRSGNDTVVWRSRGCEYAVPSADPSSCQSCLKLDFKAQTEEQKFEDSEGQAESSPLDDPWLAGEPELGERSDDETEPKPKDNTRIEGRKLKKSDAKVLAFRKICDICCVTFEREDKYNDDQRKHELSKKSNETVQCPSCLVTISKTSVNSHFDLDHPELKAGVCLECLKVFSPKEKVSVHFHRCHREVTSQLCPICGTRTSSLKAHINKAHKSEKPSKLLCVQCGGEFASKVILNRHIQFVHESKKIHACKFCGQKFKTESHLRMHYWSLHLKAKPYKCRHCAYVAKQPNRIYEHCRDVHKLRGSRSDVVEVQGEFERIKEFETQHGIYRKKMKRRPPSAKHCFLCDKFLEQGLEAHELSHLQLSPYACAFQGCGMAFVSKKMLEDHRVSQHYENIGSEFKIECDDSVFELYTRVKSLPARILKESDKFWADSSRQCKKCGASFPGLAGFYIHAVNCHGEDQKDILPCDSDKEEVAAERKLVCKKCGLETLSTKVLDTHLREIHQMSQSEHETYVPPPVVQLEPKPFRPRQFRCRHCVTYTAVKKFTVHRHIRKVHKIQDSTDQDLMLINEAVPTAAAALTAAATGGLKLEQILNSVKE